MKLGMIGLGRMGGNMAERLRRNGHDVVGYDRDPQTTQVATLQELVAALPTPRVVWVMVPAGPATEETVSTVGALLAKDDVLIEGGNSFYRDSIRRAATLAERGVGFIDAGTSGGIWGLSEGYCIMAGGDPAHVAVAQPIFDALVQADGFAHVGPVGAGHFTKMVHNGIEYGMMQAFGEGYDLLQASDVGVDVGKAVEVWRHGSVVRSWLLDLMAGMLKRDATLEGIAPVVADSGEGRWAAIEAVELGVPAPVISLALAMRFASQGKGDYGAKQLALLRHSFGGHAVSKQKKS